jgi:hypothetical protein
MPIMSDARHIHDYLDGSLDPSDETTLFATLASDADARRELTQQIRLHLAVKKDLAAIAVPADATSAIFSSLGYAVPGAAPAVPVVLGSASRWRRRSVLLLLLLLAVGTGMLTRMWWPSVAYVAVPTTARPAAFTMSAPAAASDVRDVGATPPVAQASPTSAVMPSTEPIMQTVTSTPVMTTSALQRHIDATPLSIVDGSDMPMLLAASAPRSSLSVLADGRSNLAMDPIASAPMDGDAALEQFTIGLSYDLDADQALALVGGRQRMAQEFTRFENGRDVVYRQLPSLWWAGLMYAHSIRGLGIDDVMAPYAQVTAGWMQTGPMARAGVGVTLAPAQRWSFRIGLDGTAILYPIQSRYFTSTSWSVSYGLSYRF